MFAFFRRKQPETPAASLASELSAQYGSLASSLPPEYQITQLLGVRLPRHTLLARNSKGSRFVVSCWESPWDPEFLKRADRELEVGLQLRQPGIVPILQAGRDSQWIWWIRPWIEGESLEDRLQRGPVQASEGEPWLRQLVATLDSAHHLGMVHRQLHPGVLWIEAKQVVVSDFVMTFPLDADRARVGTTPFEPEVSYLAPEQITSGPLRPASNYFSLGVIAFQMFTGRLLFQGDSVIETILKILQEEPPRLTEIVPDLPDSLADVISRLLIKDPLQRLCNAAEVLELLNEATSQPMQGLLRQLQEEGSCVASQSTFTLNPAQALQKLQGHQFEEPQAFLWMLSAAASALGCSRLDITTTGPRACTLSYREVELTRPELESLWSFAFARNSPGLRHLALGLAAAQSQLVQANLQISCSGWGVALKSLQPIRLAPRKPTCLTLTLKSSVDLELDPELLTSRFAYSPTAIYWDGTLLAPPLTPNRPPISLDQHHFALSIRAARHSEWTAVVDGMSFRLDYPSGPPLQLVVWGPFQVDLSHRRLVLNPLLSRVMKALEMAAEEAIKDLAMAPDRLNSVYVRWALDHWQKEEQSEALQACYENLLRQALELPDDSLGYPQIAEAWNYLGALPQRPAIYWKLHTRLPFLKDASVATLSEVARNAFPEPRAALEWRLQMWLVHNLSRPGPDQVQWLLTEAGRYQISPQGDQDLRLASVLAEGFPEVPFQRWLEFLPESWVKARAVLAQRLRQEIPNPP